MAALEVKQAQLYPHVMHVARHSQKETWPAPASLTPHSSLSANNYMLFDMMTGLVFPTIASARCFR